MKKIILLLSFSFVYLMASDFFKMTIGELMQIKDSIAVADKEEYKKEILNRVNIMSFNEKEFFKEFIDEDNISNSNK
jgi:hypothetical protein